MVVNRPSKLQSVLHFKKKFYLEPWCAGVQFWTLITKKNHKSSKILMLTMKCLLKKIKIKKSHTYWTIKVHPLPPKLKENSPALVFLPSTIIKLSLYDPMSSTWKRSLLCYICPVSHSHMTKELRKWLQDITRQVLFSFANNFGIVKSAPSKGCGRMYTLGMAINSLTYWMDC